jgi:(E)-4-hydroxy-3-methylbut-2-enyl-diphosphate synthase
MGDTIRVSLTEAPEAELPVASQLLNLFPKPDVLPYEPFQGLAWDPFNFSRRKSLSLLGLGNGSRVKIISPEPPDPEVDLKPEQLDGKMVRFEEWEQEHHQLKDEGKLLLIEKGPYSIQQVKARLSRFCTVNKNTPIVVKINTDEEDPGLSQIQLAGELGSLLVDGVIDGVWAVNPHLTPAMINETVLNILQSARARISKTEYIACPSCGRTHFDILARLQEIRSATSHLTTLKIGVMGCIVNGPGEMADADYGYVGAGPGRVSIYKRKEARIRNIPEKEALGALIDLLKKEGDWIEP